MLQKLMQFFRCPLAQRAVPDASSALETEGSSSTRQQPETCTHARKDTLENNAAAADCATSAARENLDHGQTRSKEDIVPSFAQRLRQSQVTAMAHDILRQRYNKLMESDQLGLQEEFTSLRDSGASYDVARQRENASKNRYCNVLPFDFNRVRMDDNELYINASLLRSADGEEPCWAYVAAQGPLPSTTPDFWQMVLENRVPAVVMLTRIVENNHTKCADYFPQNIGESAVYGRFEITPLDAVHIGHSICQRTIRVKRVDTEEVLVMQHFNYQVWPDHGVPETVDAILQLSLSLQHQLDRAQAGALGKNAYSNVTVVHCSAGIGRTGAFIAIDIILRRLTTLENSNKTPTEEQIKECMNVLAVVQDLRHQRRGMVQTLEQYQLIYRALLTQFETTGSE